MSDTLLKRQRSEKPCMSLRCFPSLVGETSECLLHGRLNGPSHDLLLSRIVMQEAVPLCLLGVNQVAVHRDLKVSSHAHVLVGIHLNAARKPLSNEGSRCIEARAVTSSSTKLDINHNRFHELRRATSNDTMFTRTSRLC